jgi:hypothetical protein
MPIPMAFHPETTRDIGMEVKYKSHASVAVLKAALFPIRNRPTLKHADYYFSFLKRLSQAIRIEPTLPS